VWITVNDGAFITCEMTVIFMEKKVFLVIMCNTVDMCVFTSNIS
jgi:hypothetical protein